jgi:hypothetical protein
VQTIVHGVSAWLLAIHLAVAPTFDVRLIAVRKGHVGAMILSLAIWCCARSCIW